MKPREWREPPEKLPVASDLEVTLRRRVAETHQAIEDTHDEVVANYAQNTHAHLKDPEAAQAVTDIEREIIRNRRSAVAAAAELAAGRPIDIDRHFPPLS